MNSDTDLNGRIAAVGTDFSVQRFNPLQHSQGTADSATGIFADTTAQRHAENNHEAVADELVEEAALLRDDLVHRGEVSIQPPQHLLRWLSGAQGSKAADVREQHGCGSFFSSENNFILPFPDLLGYFRRNIAGKHTHDLFAISFRHRTTESFLYKLIGCTDRQNEQQGGLGSHHLHPVMLECHESLCQRVSGN